MKYFWNVNPIVGTAIFVIGFFVFQANVSFHQNKDEIKEIKSSIINMKMEDIDNPKSSLNSYLTLKDRMNKMEQQIQAMELELKAQSVKLKDQVVVAGNRYDDIKKIDSQIKSLQSELSKINSNSIKSSDVSEKFDLAKQYTDHSYRSLMIAMIILGIVLSLYVFAATRPSPKQED